MEGMIVLFRIAIAIFIINEKELLETTSPSAFYSFVHSMTSHLFSVDRLLKVRESVLSKKDPIILKSFLAPFFFALAACL